MNDLSVGVRTISWAPSDIVDIRYKLEHEASRSLLPTVKAESFAIARDFEFLVVLKVRGTRQKFSKNKKWISDTDPCLLAIDWPALFARFVSNMKLVCKDSTFYNFGSKYLKSSPSIELAASSYDPSLLRGVTVLGRRLDLIKEYLTQSKFQLEHSNDRKLT